MISWTVTAKEIQLKHHAPVISIVILDRTATPLPDPLSVSCGVSKPADNSGSHQLLLASEEQFKVSYGVLYLGNFVFIVVWMQLVLFFGYVCLYV